MNIINKELIEAAHKYVKGEIKRELVIQKANKYFELKTYHKEGIFYNLLGKIFDDPEDNELLVTRESIIQVLDNYIKKSISLEEIELWFWDVIDLNVNENDSEEDLIYYLLHFFDNLAINVITNEQIIEVNRILKNTKNSECALKKVKKTFKE